MHGGDRLYDDDRQACREIKKAGSEGHGCISAATHDADLRQADESDQQSVDTLCTRKKLKNQGLAEKIRIIRAGSCSCLTRNANAICAAHT